MTDFFKADWLKALPLTKVGRLADVTAALQRKLIGASEAVASPHASPIIERGDHVKSEPPDGAKPAMANVLRGFLDQTGLGGFPFPGTARHGEFPAASQDAALANGKFLTGTFSDEAGTRPYKLYVPTRYRRGRPVPLIVMLHGCTQSPDDFAAGTRMNELAEADRCLVVYPGQVAAANRHRCWNWFNRNDQRRDQGEPALIAGITRQVMRDYTVDPRRVFVAGLSAGGAQAAIMGTTYPDLYAAIGVHSGLACGAANDLSSALIAMRIGSTRRGVGSLNSGVSDRIVPTIVFHGDKDATVNPRNGDDVVAASVHDAPFQKRREDGHVSGGHAYSRISLVDGSGKTVAEQWVIHGAGHAWSGGSPAGSYTDPLGPDASQEMMRFFLQNPHPAPA